MPRKPKVLSRWLFRRRLPKPERREIVEISDVAAILARRDPLLRLLDTLSGQRSWRTYALALGLYGTLMVGAGIAISVWYQHKGIQFLSLLDKRELPFALFVFLFVAPVIWLFYAWQLRGILEAIRLLKDNRALGHTRSNPDSLSEFVNASVDLFNCRTGFVVSTAITAAVLVIWLMSLSPSNPFLYGFPAPWWLLNPFYFWIVWMPLVFVNVHMMTWVVIRQAFAAAVFAGLFRVFEIDPKPFHPDKCNGFAPLGDFSIRAALIAVLFGFWVSGVISYPMFFGQPINLRPDTILALVLYVLIVPAVLIPPVWECHREMVNAKQQTLDSLAERIQGLLDETNLETMVSDKEALEGLIERYRLLETELRIWPFRPLALRRFGVSAIMPLLSTAVSFVIDNYVL